MFAYKNTYYLYIENTQILNLNIIKIRNKFTVIYRNTAKAEKLEKLIKFRLKCRQKGIKFFVANDIKLTMKIKADGLYLSAFNKSFIGRYRNFGNLDLIGSAHNYKEIQYKKKQGCSKIVLSRLFKTDYKKKRDFMGIIKFNITKKLSSIELIPLGGIRISNLNYLKIVNSRALAILSEIKKKPAIISRLF
ncbi:thiamine phosphate synthase [Pelagibacteraceae bacterium]|jgi:thiamine monophosphate synthase|nr:thiamine phosphate synthase [Pelagibacteraceae bacterium]|tara:strand:+ start:54 stop:626 length:573 start_codon:yes stop_codon:yes gene_type:complete